MHIGQVWEVLSREAKQAMVIGEDRGPTVRRELMDHELLEGDARDFMLSEKGQKVAAHGRWAFCNMLDNLQERFLYFTECALATVEELEMLARPPKSRLRRHRSIADKMLFELKLMKLTPDDAKKHKCGRVMEALQEKDEEGIDTV